MSQQLQLRRVIRAPVFIFVGIIVTLSYNVMLGGVAYGVVAWRSGSVVGLDQRS